MPLGMDSTGVSPSDPIIWIQTFAEQGEVPDFVGEGNISTCNINMTFSMRTEQVDSFYHLVEYARSDVSVGETRELDSGQCLKMM